MSDLSPDARELLLAARQEDGPTPLERQRLRRAVFSAVATGTMLGSAGAAGAAASGLAAGTTNLSLVAGVAAKMGAAPLAIWFAVGAGAGIATVTPVAAYRYVTSPSAAESPASATTERAAARETPPLRHEPPAVVGPPFAPLAPEVALNPASENAQPDPASEAAPASTRSNGVGAPAFPPSPAPASAALERPALGVELDLLGAAQRELAAGRAEGALARLNEHERRFPSGALTGERLAARVFALCALGRAAEARLVTLEFERVAPGSPLTPRVLASCGGTPRTGGAP
jgi:hypothetical protein